MMNSPWVKTEEIVQKLFDPRYEYRGIAPQVKYGYLLQYLESRWLEICGPALAESCHLQRIEGQTLIVSVDNSLLASELYMMKQLFLQKVNAVLLGKVIVKDARFHTGGYWRRHLPPPKAAEPEEAVTIHKCSRCGAKTRSQDSICYSCQREQEEDLRQSLRELLQLQPWLDYGQALQFIKCDELLFRQVKDSMSGYYYEKVRTNMATDQETLLAVLLLTGLEPTQLTQAKYDNSLEFLRRQQYVSPFRS